MLLLCVYYSLIAYDAYFSSLADDVFMFCLCVCVCFLFLLMIFSYSVCVSAFFFACL